MMDQKRKSKYRKSKRSIVEQFDNMDVLAASENLTNNTAAIKKILQKANEPEYLHQFDAQTFDNTSLPSAFNDVYHSSDRNRMLDLERQMSFNAGWSEVRNDRTNMTYGVVPDEEFTHNNMNPLFSVKRGYGSNDQDHAKDIKTSLFTGTMTDTWRPKSEVRSMFKPEESRQDVYDKVGITADMRDRFIPSQYYQGQKPFRETQVTPGLNLDYNEVGTHGNFDMVRPLPKTIDDIRTVNNPKISYKGVVIESGLRGEMRPIQAPVMSYKPESYRAMTEADMLPTSDSKIAPKTRDNIIMKETTRPDTHIEYTGGAYNREELLDQTISNDMKPKIKASTRQNFLAPKPMNKHNPINTVFNSNLKSYDLPANARDQTQFNDYTGPAGTHQMTYSNLSDVSRTTMKETSLFDNLPHTVVNSNTMRGTVHNVDTARSTMKETTVAESRPISVPGQKSGGLVYNNDIARPTMKETTLDALQPANLNMGNMMYANWSDTPNTTMKEMTMGPSYSFVDSGHYAGTVQYQDDARTTQKEMMTMIPQNNFITPLTTQFKTQQMDPVRTTMKEQNIALPRSLFADVAYTASTPHHQDVARTTMKESTVSNPYNTFVQSSHQGNNVGFSDIAKNTLKETTVTNPWNTFVGTNETRGTVYHQDLAKNTMKETTTGIQRNTFMNSSHNGVFVPYNDVAKQTMKETTTTIPQNTFITGADGVRSHMQDDMRVTTKQTTVGLARNNNISAGPGHRSFLQDEAKTTMKESTVNIPYSSFITGGSGAKTQLQDYAKTTLKETRVMNTQNTHVTGEKGPRSSLQDEAKTTMKETRVINPTNTFVSGATVGKTQLQDGAKTTLKELSLDTPAYTVVNGASKNQRPHLQDEAKTTMKEMRVVVPYNTNVTAGEKTSAYYQDIAKTTQKEMTIDNKWIGGAFDDKKKSKTREELRHMRLNDKRNVAIDRAPTNSGENKIPDSSMTSIREREYINHQLPIVPGVSHKNMERMVPHMKISGMREEANKSSFIDPYILKQLQSNPYSLNINN